MAEIKKRIPLCHKIKTHITSVLALNGDMIGCSLKAVVVSMDVQYSKRCSSSRHEEMTEARLEHSSKSDREYPAELIQGCVREAAVILNRLFSDNAAVTQSELQTDHDICSVTLWCCAW